MQSTIWTFRDLRFVAVNWGASTALCTGELGRQCRVYNRLSFACCVLRLVP